MKASTPKVTHNSTGAALILVLGVLSIISILSMQIIEAANNLSSAQFNQQQVQQSYWYAKAGEEYARLITKEYLFKKILLDKHKTLHFPITDGAINITLKPLQNCFNINSFSQRSAINVINRVLFDKVDNPEISGDTPQKKAEQALDENILGIPLKRSQLQALFSLHDIERNRADFFSDRIIDWLDEDNIPSGNHGAENSYYASAELPRETPNQHLLIKEEMQHFLANDQQDFTSVLPLLCSRPGDNKLQVNINQLDNDSAILLSAILLEKIDTKTAQSIIENRPEEGFQSLSEFWDLPEFKDMKISLMQKKALVIENRYFQVESDVSYKETKFKLVSLIRINTNKKVHVISRKYGVNS
ncbi:MAG: type II secretion system minor pseudopilin GspK [Oceanospirillaceae bacterium]|nr:type II secretion system minor pseudopilin GspK [Oceanospirillaceae bacterium]